MLKIAKSDKSITREDRRMVVYLAVRALSPGLFGQVAVFEYCLHKEICSQKLKLAAAQLVALVPYVLRTYVRCKCHFPSCNNTKTIAAQHASVRATSPPESDG
jgi:hypothetical protein